MMALWCRNMKSKNKLMIVVEVVFLIIGLLAMIIGFLMSGVNIVEWLSSRYAITCFVIIGMSLIIFIGLLIMDWIKRI